MLKLLSVCAGLGFAAMAAALSAQGQPVELKVGDKAPDFALPGSDGKIHKLSEYKSSPLLMVNDFRFPV